MVFDALHGQSPQTDGGPSAPAASNFFSRSRRKLMAEAALVLIVLLGLTVLGARPATPQPVAGVAGPGASASVGLSGSGAELSPPLGLASAARAPAERAPPASSAQPPSGSSADGSVSEAVLADGRVVLNLALEPDLMTLSGIGPVRAQAIVALRKRMGRFRSVDDLLRVKGMGRKTLARLKPKLVVDPPGPRANAASLPHSPVPGA